MYGALFPTSAGSIIWPFIGSFSYSRLCGFAKYWAKFPNTNPPNPYPEIMNPVTRPFLSGKWLHPALKTDDYINPLYNPIANENSHKKTVGLNLNDAHTNTILKATTPPIAMTGRVPPSLSTKWLPNGKKNMENMTISG